MTVVAADYDDDGWPDIYVACDSTPSLLFRNQHDGTFRQEGLERGVALSEDGIEQAGMGIAVGDYDLDGSLDIFKTHFSDDTNVPLPQRRQGLLRRRHDPRGPRRRDPVRRVGRGDGRSRQRRPPRPVRGDRQRLPRGGARAPGLSLPDAAAGLPQPRQRAVRGADRRGGPRRGGGPLEPGLRLRGLRQRRRRGRAGDEHERAAVPAAQRRLGRRPLAEGPARRRPSRTAARSAPAWSPATEAGPRRRR